MGEGEEESGEKRRTEEGEVEGKREEKEKGGMAVCSKRETPTGARGVRVVEYVWRMWRTLYTPTGSLWGHSGFWYVISEIPVYLCVACCPCAMFQLERAKRAPCDAKVVLLVPAELEGRTKGCCITNAAIQRTNERTRERANERSRG